MNRFPEDIYTIIITDFTITRGYNKCLGAVSLMDLLIPIPGTYTLKFEFEDSLTHNNGKIEVIFKNQICFFSS